ncbi:hypothetical protein GCM10009676_45620 [Prauserella halophila]|uniref:Uncharacterized protein n=1 Tax=Prauserella halophila TaxID=185641 RepID=A0ABN1WL81_9PSEU|nr:hypothetical protein [Prauserella halophila]MCP2237579.1 hypothetical protein [Prauserella halophila]
MRTRTPSGRVVPAVRGVLLAVTSAALSVTAHGAAGGGLPHPATTIVVASLIGWVATATAHRARGIRGILLFLGAGQLAAHTLLTTLSGHGGEGPAMIAGHALATVVTAYVLAHAEAVLAGVTTTVRAVLPVAVWRWRPYRRPQHGPAHPPLALPDAATTVVDVLLRRVHGRRGPPVLS